MYSATSLADADVARPTTDPAVYINLRQCTRRANALLYIIQLFYASTARALSLDDWAGQTMLKALRPSLSTRQADTARGTPGRWQGKDNAKPWTLDPKP